MAVALVAVALRPLSVASTEGPSLGVMEVGAAPGEAVEVALVAAQMPRPGLAGFDAQLRFEPRRMTVVEALPGDEPWTDNVVKVSNEEGTIRLVNAKAEGVAGTFALARFRVSATGRFGERVPLALGATILADAGLNEIAASMIDGMPIIAAGSTPMDVDNPTQARKAAAWPPSPLTAVLGAAVAALGLAAAGFLFRARLRASAKRR